MIETPTNWTTVRNDGHDRDWIRREFCAEECKEVRLRTGIDQLFNRYLNWFLHWKNLHNLLITKF